MYSNYYEEPYEVDSKSEAMDMFDLVEAKELPDREQCFEALTILTEAIWGTADISEEEMEYHFETLYDQVLKRKFETAHLKFAPSNRKSV